MAVTDTLINTLFDGRYRILRKLGSGGMANVYLAEDEELGRQVAIKILNDRHASDDQFVERFRREAKNAAGLSHPNIVSVYDRGEAEGTYYIAMEFLEGRSLKDRIVSGGRLPTAAAIEVTRQILHAVGFAHRRGIVHRDIKPHNVLLADDGSGNGEPRFKVTDFGISRTTTSQMTEAGSIVGTAQYLSPEQARGAPVDQRSDIYSVGIVLYELLTGKLPFTGETPLEIAMKHLSEVPTAPSELRPDVPADLDMVVLRALAKDPEDRFQSAEEMERELARVAGGAGVTAETAEAATAVLSGAGLADTAPTMISRRPVVAPRRPERYRDDYYEYAPPPRRRRPVWPWLLAILLLAGALVAGVYVWNQIQDEISGAKPVIVPFVEGQRWPEARQNIRNAGLRPVRVNRSHETFAVGIVFRQTPDAGERVARGNAVRIFVSTGKPRVDVPDVLGAREADALFTIRAAGLVPDPYDIFSDKPSGTVIAQDPKGGTSVVKGSTVRVNISKGQQNRGIPTVTGLSYDRASEQLRQEGFTPVRQDVDSSEPKGIVVDQEPPPGSLHPPGTKVTLSVSTGQEQTTVPDVVGLDEESARANLENAGFEVVVRYTGTDDPAEEGAVVSQTPGGGAEAEPDSRVTIYVGRLQVTEPPPGPPPPPPPPSP
jgi:beta-lactam-binding protein with PASTA domain/tRNA A-37 threonylcarbamoyl transferase component Bud32